MPNKSPRSPGSNATRKADDFRIINGLPKTAKTKLHAAGILTFAQLAAMSPHEIVAAIGDSEEVTAERIIREDWVGQASKLAASREDAAEPAAEPPAPASLPSPDGKRTSFALELQLNDDDLVKQTRVMHVESQEKDAEEIWMGWDETRLLDFIVHRAKIALPPKSEAKQAEQEELAAAKVSIEERLNQLHAKSDAATAPHNLYSPPQSAGDLPASLSPPATARKLEVFAGDSSVPSGLTPSGEPYNVRVLLDPSEINSLTADELAYTVTVYAKSLVSSPTARQHLVVGESKGVIAAKDDLVFTVEGAKLAQGAYRLRAAATFNAASAETAPRRNVTTFVEGGVLQVY